MAGAYIYVYIYTVFVCVHHDVYIYIGPYWSWPMWNQFGPILYSYIDIYTYDVSLFSCWTPRRKKRTRNQVRDDGW